MHNATTYKNATIGPFAFLGDEILNMNPLNALLWIVGAVLLFSRIRFRQVRAVAWIFPVVLLILLISGTAKPYYLSPAFTLPLGAGAAWIESFTRRMRRNFIPQIAVLALIAIPGFTMAPMAMPVLPANQFISYSRAIGYMPSVGERKEIGVLPQFYADMFGWKQLASAVSQVYHSLPEAGSGKVMIYGQNYGEAGAVDYFGKAFGLPPASSRHNNYWIWGPHPADPSVFIIIDDDGSDLGELFEETRLAAIHSCNLCMPYESRLEIWVCRKPKIDLRELWEENPNFN